MKLNLHILADYLGNDIVIKVHAEEILDLKFDRVEIFSPNGKSVLSEDTLYIVRAENFQKGKQAFEKCALVVFGRIDPATYSDLDHYEYIQISPGIRLKTLVNRIGEAFSFYNARQEAVFLSILSEAPPQEFFDTVAAVFPNPIMWVDSSWALVLTAGKATDGRLDQYWDTVSAEKLMNKNVISLFTSARKRNWGYIEWYQDPDLLTVFLNRGPVHYGELSLSPLNCPLTFGQASLLDHMGGIVERYLRFNKQIVQNGEYNGGMFQAFFSLLTGQPVDRTILRWVMKRFHQAYEEDRYLIVIQRKNYTISQDAVLNMLQVAREWFPQGICFSYNDQVLLLLRTKDYPYMDCPELLKAANEATPDSWKFGVSFPFPVLDYLPCAFYQCETAMTIGTEREGWRKKLFFYEKYFYQAILNAKTDPDNLRASCHPIALYLSDYDKEYRTDYVFTLYTYLSAGGKTQKAADMLRLHRNTLSYRLKQIQELVHQNCYELERIDYLFISCSILLDLSH